MVWEAYHHQKRRKTRNGIKIGMPHEMSVCIVADEHKHDSDDSVRFHHNDKEI